MCTYLLSLLIWSYWDYPSERSEDILSMYFQSLGNVKCMIFCPDGPTCCFVSLSFIFLFLLRIVSLIIWIEEAGGVLQFWKKWVATMSSYIYRKAWISTKKMETSSSRPELQWWFPERIHYQYQWGLCTLERASPPLIIIKRKSLEVFYAIFSGIFFSLLLKQQILHCVCSTVFISWLIICQ